MNKIIGQTLRLVSRSLSEFSRLFLSKPPQNPRPMFRILTAFLLFILIGSNVYGQATQQPPAFKNGKLTPEYSLLNHKTTNPLWQSARFLSDYYVIIQMNHLVDPIQKSELANNGIKLDQWLSGNNYLAVCDRGFSIKNPGELGIINIYALPPSLKVNGNLKNFSERRNGPRDLIALTCFPVNKLTAEKAISQTGAEIVHTKIKPAHTWFVRGGPEIIDRLSSLAFVHSISPLHLEDVPLNYYNRAIHGVQSLAATVGRNLTGNNLIVGIGDNADPSQHIDLAGKLIMRTDEPVDIHGTHTSGIIAGGGILNPMWTGMAPRSQLVVNAFSDILINSPTYVADYNMPLTNNSYYNGDAGCPGEGDYNVLSNYVDSQMLAFPKLLHVFAAGNDGQTTCSPYSIGFATIKSGFQTGKNILTIGSIDNMLYTISGYSSNGPTNDGRIKPELVAGGVNITSTIPVNAYATYNGTSLSCPTVTGILALLVERYKQLNAGNYPDGALIKALVTNSAVDLGNPGPDYTYGFGMISGRTTVEAMEQNHYFAGSVTNNSSQQFTIPSIPAGTYQLKVLLYWPDAPAIPESPKTLVNDLDLTVTEPGGTVHFPMILDPSPGNVNNNAVEGADHTNNIEQVLVNNPPAGNYTLKVNGSTVPVGPQPFYIAYEILQPSVNVEYPYGTETWVPGQTEYIRWSAYGGDPNSFTLEFSIDGGSSWNTISNTIPSTSRSYAWTVPAVVTNNALIRITRNVVGYSDMSHYPFTILDQPVLTVTSSCPGYAQLNWNSITGADSYDIMKLSGDTMQVIGNTVDTSFLVTPLNKDSSYWFSVRAVHGGFGGRRAIGQNIIPNTGPCTASILNNDLILDSVLTPVSGRQFTSTQPGIQRISVHVRNPGNLPTTSPVNFSYQVNGGAIITEVYAPPIPADSAIVYTFSPANSYDFSAVGRYNIKTWIHYSADTIPSNDTIVFTLKNLRNDPLILSPSFTEGFESATDRSYNQQQMGLDSLDRTDFSNSVPNGRASTFFNTGFARTGKRSILLDVTEQGTSAADSLINTFNLSNYSASDQIWLDLYFKKQSTVPAMPGNYVWIRGNDQAAWIPVKSLSDLIDPAGVYIKLNLDLTGILASAIPAQTISSSFQVKCGAEGKIPAASSNPVALPGGGINFDDFILTNAINDVGMRGLLQPSLKNICALSNAEIVTVFIRNYGTDTLLNIPVTYAINQDTVTETVPILLPKDSLQYSFSKTVDMSAYQSYNIKAWVSNPTDNYRNNDSSGDYTIQTTPLINQYPYLEGFESNNGYWYTNGQNDSWQWGKPAKKIIHKAANGSNAWVTNLTGNYNDNEYSFLYSPCFDLTSLTKPVLSFSHIFQTEDDCTCDFHWVEYSLDDSTWTILGNAASGVNWYDDASMNTWQLSDTIWHVSSYDIPVVASKIRFRIVMYSDPGTNYEGVAIDDVHIFEKAPVFTDSLVATLSQPVSGTNWIDFDENGERLFSINPNGQNLGNTRLTVFRDTIAIRDTAGQYYGERNWVVQTSIPASSSVGVRYYFTDSEANKLIQANSCASCLNIEDAYSSGVTQYSSPVISEEDSSLANNKRGTYIFHKPQQDVQIIPNDNGYYAETTVQGFSEFWINGGGKQQDHPLAAWLKDFTAMQVDTSGLLNWSSWQETGSLKYIAEKSRDSMQFDQIGQVAAIPHTDSVQSYNFTDPQLWAGNNYYRLVLYFQNGDSLVSPVQKIFYEGPPGSVLVFPNPTDGDITIITSLSCREIQIFDVLGRKLMDKTGQGHIQQLSIGSFSPGVYFLKLFTDSGNKLIKLEKR
jgi:Subtilase family/Secretion system C-terminal sorting domain